MANKPSLRIVRVQHSAIAIAVILGYYHTMNTTMV